MAHSVRERLQFGGPQSLSTDELLAALWGSTQAPAELARAVSTSSLAPR